MKHGQLKDNIMAKFTSKETMWIQLKMILSHIAYLDTINENNLNPNDIYSLQSTIMQMLKDLK